MDHVMVFFSSYVDFVKVNHKHIFPITSIICFSSSISYYTYCDLKIEKFQTIFKALKSLADDDRLKMHKHGI